MTDQENQKQKRRGAGHCGDQPVYYDANGNPVTPVVYYDAEGRPVIPVFAAQPVHPPQEEQYETLPDGTRVRIVYQEPESKRTSAAKPPVAPKPQVIPAEKKGKPMPDAGQSNSMHVIYESPDANHETVAPDAPVAPRPWRRRIKRRRLPLAD